MPFPLEIKAEALIACGRRCCICHKWCGVRMECHHIIPEANGGPNTLENCIPLCFDCHGEVGHYNPKHPKGNKITPEELRGHRDNWHRVLRETIMVELRDPKSTNDNAPHTDKQHDEAEEPLHESELQILKVLGSYPGIDEAALWRHTMMDRPQIAYFLEELERRKLVKVQIVRMNGISKLWHPTHEGRRFLFKRGLLF